MTSRFIVWWSFALPLAIACGLLAVHGWNAPGYDLSALVVGARVAESHGFGSLYEHAASAYNLADSAAFAEAAREVGFAFVPTPFVHPPLVAWLARPLSHLPFAWVMHGWTVLSAVALFAALCALFLTARAGRRMDRGDVVFALLVGPLCALFEPLRYSFWLGQTTVFIVLLIVWADFLADRLPALAGVVLSMAAFVKLTPLVFVLPWIVARRGRALLGLAAGLAAQTAGSIGVAGVAANETYLSRVAEIGRGTLVAFNNQALGATLLRPLVAEEETWRWSLLPTPVAVHAAVLVIAAAAAVAIASAVRPLPATLRERGLWASAALYILIFPAIVWTHYFVLLLLPLAVAWDLASSDERRLLFRALLAIAALLLVRPLALGQEGASPGAPGYVVAPALSAALTLAVLLVVAARAARGPTRPFTGV